MMFGFTACSEDDNVPNPDGDGNNTEIPGGEYEAGWSEVDGKLIFVYTETSTGAKMTYVFEFDADDVCTSAKVTVALAGQSRTEDMPAFVGMNKDDLKAALEAMVNA